MPIRPENRARYPKDWPEISRRIRFNRAGGRCECDGRCGWLLCGTWSDNGHRVVCRAENGRPHPQTGSLVVLTVAHLDHTPENCDDDNLMAMCQGCHLNYDREHHAETRAATSARALTATGQGVLDLEVS